MKQALRTGEFGKLVIYNILAQFPNKVAKIMIRHYVMHLTNLHITSHIIHQCTHPLPTNTYPLYTYKGCVCAFLMTCEACQAIYLQIPLKQIFACINGVADLVWLCMQKEGHTPLKTYHIGNHTRNKKQTDSRDQERVGKVLALLVAHSTYTVAQDRNKYIDQC